METKANHILIGVFVLGLLGLLLSFIYWMKNDASGPSGKNYYVIFDGSVQGLAESSPVLFNGIRFGAVRSIELIPEDTRKVRALIAVREDTPVRTNSHARISQQGLAGFIAMEITPGTPDSPLLHAKPGEKYPVLNADPASGSLFAGVSDAASQANALATRMNNVVANNEEAIHRTIANLDAFTTMLATHRDDVASIAEEVRALTTRLNETSRKLDEAVDRLAGSATDHPESVVSQVQQAATSFRALTEKLDRTIGDKSGQLTQQAERSLREFELFMKDGRRLADSLDRVVQKVERNPSGFLLGGQQTPKY
jgi:phospholipid/cholesterol/gamma-HCH transport system substrate-binding protein